MMNKLEKLNSKLEKLEKRFKSLSGRNFSDDDVIDTKKKMSIIPALISLGITSLIPLGFLSYLAIRNMVFQYIIIGFVIFAIIYLSWNPVSLKILLIRIRYLKKKINKASLQSSRRP